MIADPTLDAAIHGDAQGARATAGARTFTTHKHLFLEALRRGQDIKLGDAHLSSILLASIGSENLLVSAVAEMLNGEASKGVTMMLELVEGAASRHAEYAVLRAEDEA